MLDNEPFLSLSHSLTHSLTLFISFNNNNNKSTTLQAGYLFRRIEKVVLATTFTATYMHRPTTARSRCGNIIIATALGISMIATFGRLHDPLRFLHWLINSRRAVEHEL